MHLTGSGINARIELKNEEDQNVNIDGILREYPSIKTYFLSKFPEHVLQLFPFLSDNDILTVYNYTVKSLIKSITEFNIPNFNVNQMKKLRKNRVIPVGWEMAALKIAQSAKDGSPICPASGCTLNDVVNQLKK